MHVPYGSQGMQLGPYVLRTLRCKNGCSTCASGPLCTQVPVWWLSAVGRGLWAWPTRRRYMHVHVELET